MIRGIPNIFEHIETTADLPISIFLKTFNNLCHEGVSKFPAEIELNMTSAFLKDLFTCFFLMAKADEIASH